MIQKLTRWSTIRALALTLVMALALVPVRQAAAESSAPEPVALQSALRVAAIEATYRAAVATVRAMDREAPGSPAARALGLIADDQQASLRDQEDELLAWLGEDPVRLDALVGQARDLLAREPMAASALEGAVGRLSSAQRAASPVLALLEERLAKLGGQAFSAWAEGQRDFAPSSAVRAQALARLARVTALETAGGEITGSGFAKGTLAITFDDGPHRTYTPEVLAILAKNKVKVTFFELSQPAQALPGLSREVLAQGHVLGDHSIDHPLLTHLAPVDAERQISVSKQVLTTITGQAPIYFRCPYGDRNAAILALIAKYGMRHVLWNIDSRDWADHDPASIVTRVMTQLDSEGRGVVLIHDIHPQSVQAASLLLDKLAPRIAAGTLHVVTIPQGVAGTGRAVEAAR